LFLELTLAIGGHTAEELAAKMSSDEWEWWCDHYSRRGPWGSRRHDFYLAQIAQVGVNVAMARGKPRRLEDFMLWDRPRQAGVSDGKEALAIFQAMAEAHGK
jgi:hypothetical protein